MVNTLTTSSSNRISSFQLMFGREERLPGDRELIRYNEKDKGDWSNETKKRRKWIC